MASKKLASIFLGSNVSGDSCDHSGYITVVEPYQLLCYWSNFSKLLLADWFKVRPRRYDFHSAKQPKIWNFEWEKRKWQYHSQYKYNGRRCRLWNNQQIYCISIKEEYGLKFYTICDIQSLFIWAKKIIKKNLCKL